MYLLFSVLRLLLLLLPIIVQHIVYHSAVEVKNETGNLVEENEIERREQNCKVNVQECIELEIVKFYGNRRNRNKMARNRKIE